MFRLCPKILIFQRPTIATMLALVISAQRMQ